MPLPYSYGEAAPGSLGGVVDMTSSTTDTGVSVDSSPEGILPGFGVFAVPSNYTGFATYGTVPRQLERNLSAAPAQRKLCGFARAIVGKPSEAFLPAYLPGDAVPYMRQGRLWVACENINDAAGVPPDVASLADTWFIRVANSPTAGTWNVGTLRFGNADDPGSGNTCNAIPAGTIRALRQFSGAPGLPGGIKLVAIEFDFRNNPAFA